MALNYQPKQNSNNNQLKGTVSQNMDTLMGGQKLVEDPGNPFTNPKYNSMASGGSGGLWGDTEGFYRDLDAYRAQTASRERSIPIAIRAALDSSNERADAYTGQTAIQNASDNLNKYESVGRAEGAQMSTNDDAYQAATFKEQNLQQNRINTLQDTINEGQALLKSYGMSTNAAGLAEAQNLLNQSKSQMQLADTMSTLSSILQNFKGSGGTTK